MTELDKIKKDLIDLGFIQVDPKIFDNYKEEISIKIIDKNNFIIDFNNEDCILEEQRQWYSLDNLYQLISDLSKD